MKTGGLVEIWKKNARKLKRQTYALYFAYRDPRVPWYAKGFIALVVAYAFSPIDLIPDFIPVLGYLDDLVLIPLGVAAAVRMIPAEVMRDSREKAERLMDEDKPIFRWMGAAIIVLWVVVILLIAWLAARRWLK